MFTINTEPPKTRIVPLQFIYQQPSDSLDPEKHTTKLAVHYAIIAHGFNSLEESSNKTISDLSAILTDLSNAQQAAEAFVKAKLRDEDFESKINAEGEVASPQVVVGQLARAVDEACGFLRLVKDDKVEMQGGKKWAEFPEELKGRLEACMKANVFGMKRCTKCFGVS